MTTQYCGIISLDAQIPHVGKLVYLPLACLWATNLKILGPELVRAIYYLQQPHYQRDSGFSDQMMTRI